jgi:hypothetical protein
MKEGGINTYDAVNPLERRRSVSKEKRVLMGRDVPEETCACILVLRVSYEIEI